MYLKAYCLGLSACYLGFPSSPVQAASEFLQTFHFATPYTKGLATKEQWSWWGKHARLMGCPLYSKGDREGATQTGLKNICSARSPRDRLLGLKWVLILEANCLAFIPVQLLEDGFLSYRIFECLVFLILISKTAGSAGKKCLLPRLITWV